MFEAKLGNALLLKRIVEAIKDLVKDAPFDCSENAFCLQAMDDSHVALVSLKLEVGLFETYRCDRSINLGISMANMAKALKCANNDDTCLIRYDDNQRDTVTFSFVDTKKDRTQDVTVKLMDIDQDHLGIPDQDYACIVTMPSQEFQKICRDLALFSDNMNIAATKGGITFSGRGDTGETTVHYNQGGSADEEGENVSIQLSEPVTIGFSNKYMTLFSKAASLSDTVKLSISNDVPIVVEFDIDNNGYLRFYLAPKIDENEEAKMEDADR